MKQNEHRMNMVENENEKEAYIYKLHSTMKNKEEKNKTVTQNEHGRRRK